jgi:hypothetical protein
MWLVGFMVFNATFNNNSVIWWRSVLLMEETEVPEKTIDLSQVTDKLYHIMLYRVHLDWGKKLLRAYVVLFYYVPNQNKVFLSCLTTLVVIGTDCINPTTIWSRRRPLFVCVFILDIGSLIYEWVKFLYFEYTQMGIVFIIREYMNGGWFSNSCGTTKFHLF